MRRAGRGALAAVAALLASACASAGPGDEPTATSFATVWEVREPGTGVLLLSDLDAGDDRFDGPAGTVEAAIVMRADDCLVALVDGVERIPFWPDGTDVFRQLATEEESAEEPSWLWSVSLPDGRAVRVGATGYGETFTARAVLAEPRAIPEVTPAPAGTQPAIVDAHLAACAVAAPPVAFVDAASIVTEWERTYADLPDEDPPQADQQPAPPSARVVEIYVDEHQFTIGHLEGPFPDDPWLPVPLVWGITETAAQVSTGIATGQVRVTSIALDAAPEDVDPWWEDVVELSLAATADWPLSAVSMWTGDEVPADRLDGHGPGTYRVRVHSNGRDIAWDGVVSQPVEDYLLLAWPAPAAPPATLRATSEVGLAEIRDR